MFRLVSVVFVFLFCAYITFSQFGSNGARPVLVKGIVTDEASSKPSGVEIEFRDSKGKKIKTNSNSIYGTYEQLLNAGETYTVILNSEDILRKTETITVEKSDKFTEQKVNFTVKKLVSGTNLYSLDMFNPNNSQIKFSLNSEFEELQEMMKFNRSIQIEFRIDAHDTYSFSEIKPIQTETKKGRKSKKSAPKPEPVKEPDMNALKSLVDSRINSIKPILEDNGWKRYKTRITIEPDYTAGKSHSGTSSPSTNTDLNIIIKSVQNVFE